ncbi:2038_t:CDS:1 [Ambispora leptoticha]|uniref:2038_t:CDS:1 n=1 Tax=Ambispora leptoticha TaxID=144679 RepID=A0A9N8Z1J4_9GLOM|nr:2038_t:CDS:1 [Ambispora leptoticha]
MSLEAAKDIVSTGSEIATGAAIKTKEAAQELLTQPGQYYQQSHRFITNIWNKSSFLRLYSYIAGAYGIIPAVILVGWIIVTLVIVVGIAGIGIVVAEGFFAFLGSLVFFPVVGTLLFLASVGGIVVGFVYASYKAIEYALSAMGFLPRDFLHGAPPVSKEQEEAS